MAILPRLKSEASAECAEYQTCEKINGFFAVPAHRPAKENLDKLRMLSEVTMKTLIGI